MSLLLSHRKLGIDTTLRVDVPEWEALAEGLHSSARIARERCPPDTPADLAWPRPAGGQWQILLHGAPWHGAVLSRDDLFLQSDSLLDDLIRERLQEFPQLHAGAVMDPAGRVAVICGSSGAGKTSLVTACVLRGWRWLSDEHLCFRQTDPLVVEGFRRNFNLKERSFATFPETAALPGTRELVRPGDGQRVRFFNADELPGGKFVPQGKVHLLILPEYLATATPPAATPIAGAAFVARLVPELHRGDASVIAWLAELARTVPVFALQYADPRAAAASLGSLMIPL